MLHINEHSSHYYEQFGDCLVKNKQILSILQGFKQGIGFSGVRNFALQEPCPLEPCPSGTMPFTKIEG